MDEYETDLDQWVDALGKQWKFVIPENTLREMLDAFTPDVLFALLWYYEYGNFDCAGRLKKPLSADVIKIIEFLYNIRTIGVFGIGMDEERNNAEPKD